MSLGHPRWQDGPKNGAKRIASRSHSVTGREPRHSERGPKVAVEGRGGEPRPKADKLGMDRSLCGKESQAELSKMLGFAPYRRNARLWPSSSKRANSCPLASAPFAAARSRCWGFDGLPVGLASTIRKAATTPSAEPSKTSANLLRNAGFPTAPTQASPAAQRSRPSTPANRPPRLERCRALAQESEALLAFGLRLEKGDAL